MKRIVIGLGATTMLAAIALLGLGRPFAANTPAAAPTHALHEAAAATSRSAIVAPPNGARVDITTRGATKVEEGYVVETRIVSRDGKPVSDAIVRFYELVDFFGPREELIGTARTDGQGSATLTYLPAKTGTHDIAVRFAGQGSLVPSVGTATFEATVAAPPYRSDEPALLAFTRLVPYAAGAIVLAVWGLIAFALFGTARGIAVRAAQTSTKEDTA
jgi:hypothetical protein